MRFDKYGQLILSEDDICEIYLKEPEKILKQVLTDSAITIPSVLEITSPRFNQCNNTEISVIEFDAINQKVWHMPEEYKTLDIAKYVLDRCQNESELQRAGEELLLFQERNMFELLKYLKYLVDIMRKNNIVWGVGRGSSVSSFVLYLIGIHKINSLYFDLSIEEFLK